MQADRSAGEVKHACTFAQVPLARLAHPSALVTLGEPWQPAASVAMVAIEDRNVHSDCHRKPCRSSKVMALRWCTKRTIDQAAPEATTPLPLRRPTACGFACVDRRPSHGTHQRH